MKTAAFAIDHLQNPITLSLMILLLLIKLAERPFRKLKIMFLLHPYSIARQKQYYRLITADLVHHDWFHLFINEYLLYVYGGNLENYLNGCGRTGSLQFIIIYLVSCVSGSLMVTLMHRKEFGFSSAGASASIVGCLFSYVILQPKRTAFYLPGLGAITNLYFGLFWIVVLFVYQRRSKNQLMNHEQHFFGAVGGIVTTLIMFPMVIR